jgi:hypothetical protein
MPEGITDEQTGDQYYQTTSDHKNDGPNFRENSSSGAFFVTGVPASDWHLWRSNDSLFSVDDNQGLEEPSGETLDPADVADMLTFEELTRSINLSSGMAVNHLPGNSLPGVLEGPELQTNHTEAATFETGSTVIVDWFPSHGAGAPIPGIPQGSSIYNMHCAALSDLDWAPFQSQRDWEVARWAKLCSATSMAVSKLLAILEVCPYFV